MRPEQLYELVNQVEYCTTIPRGHLKEASEGPNIHYCVKTSLVAIVDTIETNKETRSPAYLVIEILLVILVKLDL